MTTTVDSRTLCRRLTQQIADEVPEGLGRWDGAWSIVAVPSDAFLDRLREWESLDNAETRERVNRAAGDLLAAWRRAAQEWDHAGRPGAREGVPA